MKALVSLFLCLVINSTSAFAGDLDIPMTDLPAGSTIELKGLLPEVGVPFPTDLGYAGWIINSWFHAAFIGFTFKPGGGPYNMSFKTTSDVRIETWLEPGTQFCGAKLSPDHPGRIDRHGENISGSFSGPVSICFQEKHFVVDVDDPTILSFAFPLIDSCNGYQPDKPENYTVEGVLTCMNGGDEVIDIIPKAEESI